MDKNRIKKIILDQSLIKEKKDIIKRELENDIEKNKKSKQILILSGIRRCGKSTLLHKIRSKNKESDYYLNFDDERLIDFKVDDFQKLYEIFLELFGEQKTFYFDEIQNIENWERFVRRIHDDGNKIYITGSNASMLSRELGTHLTGRHVQKKLFPFSFREFLNYNNIRISNVERLDTRESIKMKKAFNLFFKKGGFPEYLKTNDIEYLKSLYESIIYRDIVTRYKLTNEKQIKELVFYSASNIGKEVSFNSLKNVIGVKNSTTVKEYFGYLENSFLVFLLPKYDYSLKKQIYYNKKLYIIDNALAQAVGFRFSEDYGRMLENIVFLELKRRAKEIFYHQAKKECDFIIKEGIKIVEAIQIVKTMSEEKTRKREMDGLIEAMEAYKLKQGLILTEDEEGEEMIANKKIKIMPVWKWLLRI